MLKVGIGNEFYCKPYGFEEGLKRLRNHGYEGIDYQGFVNTDTPLFEKSAHEFEEALKEQHQAIKAAGLRVHQTHGPWRYPPQDSTIADREERFEKMSRAIAGTAILGCKNIVIHPIMPFSTKDEGYEKQTWEMNLEFMERLCKVGRDSGVVICFENMPMQQLSLATVPEILKFVKTIHDDYFKVCLDTGHCVVRGQSPAEAVRMIGKEYLYALHVHDNDGQRDRHWNPFTGVIDWEDIGKALREIQYDGVLSLEVKRTSSIPEQLVEYEEIGLYRKAKYIAELADGHSNR